MIPFSRLWTRRLRSDAGKPIDLEQYLFPGLLALIALNVGVLVVTAASLTALKQARAAAREATATNIQLEQVYVGLRDAESGQRGYIITGDATYLAPYTAGSKQVPQLLTALRPKTTDPTQAHELTQVAALSNKKLAELARTVALRRDQGFDAAIAVVSTNAGRDYMEEAHAVLQKMEAQVTAQGHAKDSAASRLVITSYISLFVSFLLTLGLVYFIRQLFAQTRLRSVLLENTNAELNRSNRELQDFASVASHDLQEPLRKIQAFGDRLKSSTVLPEDAQQYLGRMLDASGRMRVLIDDLLAFSRVTTKAQPFTRVSLGKIVREVLSDMEIKLEDTNADVQVKRLPIIDADAVQMRQLFQNLISNGLKFSKPGVRPRLEIYSTMTKHDGRDEAIISVQDNGIGFDTKYLDRIFTIFQRLHGRNEYEGTGIGLAVVRKIAERHKGTITAESEPDKGARFIITLPINQEHKDI